MPRKPRKNRKLNERAKPIREVLRKLVHKKVKTREEREALAKVIGQSVSSVNNMIYTGEGGLDPWIGALSFCYNLDPKNVEHTLEDYERYLRKANPVSRNDRLYFELTELLSEDDLHMLLSLIKASALLSAKK